MKVDADGIGAEKVYKAGEISIPTGFYRVEEITQETCTIRRMPGTEYDLSFRFHQKAPPRWVIGAMVECRLNPKSPTGRTIKRWEDWDNQQSSNEPGARPGGVDGQKTGIHKSSGGH